MGRPKINKLCQETQLGPMAAMDVSLPDPVKSWVEAPARGRRHSNVGVDVRDLIRKEQAHQQAVGEIQGLLT